MIPVPAFEAFSGTRALVLLLVSLSTNTARSFRDLEFILMIFMSNVLGLATAHLSEASNS